VNIISQTDLVFEPGPDRDGHKIFG